MRIAVIDCETSTIGDDAEPLEIAVAVLNDGAIKHVSSILVQPDNPIAPEASAVHHITAKTMEAESVYSKDYAREWFVNELMDCEAVAAHNVKFDREFVPDLASIPWICTMVVAKHLWPEAPNYKLQTLRYWLDLPEEKVQGHPHRAAYDTVCAAHLLNREIAEVNGNLDYIMELSNTIPLLRTCHFGMHRGKAWRDIPRDYMAWIIRQGDFDEEVTHTCRYYLEGKRDDNRNDQG